MGFATGVQPAHKAGIVAAFVAFVIGDKPEGIFLGQPADGRCGVEFVQQVAQAVGRRQPEAEVGFQVYHLSGTGSVRAVLGQPFAIALQNPADVVCHVALFFQVLPAPVGGHYFALHGHGACQGYGVPVRALPAEQNLRGTAYPGARCRGVAQVYHHARIAVAGFHKGGKRREIIVYGQHSGARQNKFLKASIPQGGDETLEGFGITCSFRFFGDEGGRGHPDIIGDGDIGVIGNECIGGIGDRRLVSQLQRIQRPAYLPPSVRRHIRADKHQRMRCRQPERRHDKPRLAVQFAYACQLFHLARYLQHQVKLVCPRQPV